MCNEHARVSEASVPWQEQAGSLRGIPAKRNEKCTGREDK
jgi:hypothetical protein